jgi:hypothetical protein
VNKLTLDGVEYIIWKESEVHPALLGYQKCVLWVKGPGGNSDPYVQDPSASDGWR